MPGVNRQPRGLLDLLQAQSGGRNPDELSSLVRSTISIDPFYESERIEAFNEPFSLSIGQAEFIEVPEGEVWNVLSIAAEIDTLQTAGNDVHLNFGIERVPGVAPNAVWLFGEAATALGTGVSNQIVLGGFLPRPILVNPGWRIVMQIGVNSGLNPATGQMCVMFVRMDI